MIITLLSVGFLDELHGGVATAGAPDIRAAFGVDYATITASVLFVPSLVANLIEAPLFLLADRISRRWVLIVGLWIIGAGGLLATFSDRFWLYVVALSLSGLGGYSVALAQGTLMDAAPERREASMTRWALLGALGDLGAPLLLAVMAAGGLSWRWASGLGAICFLAIGLVLVGQTLPKASDDEDEPGQSLFAGLRLALKSRSLMIWLFGVALCDLLDEIFVVLAALYLCDQAGLDTTSRDFALMVVGLFGAIGLAIAEWLLTRLSARTLLVGCAIGTVAAYLVWLWSSSYVGILASLALVGLFDAPIYPIAKAQAYHTMPGRSGLVNAAAEAFTPLELAMPIALGLIADRYGLVTALLALLLQPIGVIACVWLTRSRSR